MTYKSFAMDLAKKSARIMRANFGSAMKRNWKKDDTPVTETDIKINKLVIAEVKKNFGTVN